MVKQVEFQDLGLISYSRALDIQRSVFNKLCAAKKDKVISTINQHVFLCEHPHVYTIGKSGNKDNMLIDQEKLKILGAEMIRVDRGGDITYHGPGQIVCYPVLDLELLNMGINEYVYTLEKTVIELLKEYEICGSTIEGFPGVWVDAGTSRKIKICSVGIKESRNISMHGLALNVNTDLSYFQYIHPCGFSSVIMTSMQKERNISFDISMLKLHLSSHLKRKFGI